MRLFVKLFTAAIHLVVLDAATKELAAGMLKGRSPFTMIPGFFDLAYVENRGCAWGLLQGAVWPLAAIGALALVLIAWKRKDIFPPARAAWRRVVSFVAEAMLYAGIAGNAIDRAFRGYVIDFLDFHLGASHFPCFNVADICISLSAAAIVFFAMFPEKKYGKSQARR